MMDIFLVFFLIAVPILGLLCLIVLEYQNSRNRQWSHMLSLPPAPSPPDPKPSPSRLRANQPDPQPR